MATNNASFAPLSVLAKETTTDGAVDVYLGEILEATEQFDNKYETTKKELWAYYWCVDLTPSHYSSCTESLDSLTDHRSYYIGNNGLTLFNFAPTAFQNLVYAAAGDAGMLPFLGRTRTVNSIVLLCNGISFAIQIIVILLLGSFADFGTWRPNILIGLSFVAFGVGFGWLGVHNQEDWHIGAGL